MQFQKYYLYPLYYTLIPSGDWLIPVAEWEWFYRYPASTEKVDRDCKQTTGGKPNVVLQVEYGWL